MHNVEVAKQTGSNPTIDEDVLAVTASERVRIDRFSGGHEASTLEVRIELLWKAGSVETILAVGYTGSTFQLGIGMDFDGPGDLIIRHVNGNNSALNMTGWWEGVVID